MKQFEMYPIKMEQIYGEEKPASVAVRMVKMMREIMVNIYVASKVKISRPSRVNELTFNTSLPGSWRNPTGQPFLHKGLQPIQIFQ